MSAAPFEPSPRIRLHEWLLLLLLLATFAALTLLASPRKSASFDEQFHLTAGYSYLKTGDYRLATTHPPLAGMVAALPLLADAAIVLPTEDPAWQTGNRFEFSDRFLWYANENGPALVERGRVGIVLLGLLLVAAVWFWARRLFGPAGALIAAWLAALDPNLLANSRQITTDLAVTLGILLSVGLLWLWLERGGVWRVLLTGLAAGLAMVAKYNGLLVWPIFVAVLLLHPPAHAGASGWRARTLGLLTMGIAAFALLWACYGFDFGSAKLPGFSLPLPAPFYWEHLAGTLTGLLEEGAVKPDFLLGQVSTQGWWYYFPVAAALKTPLPTLLLAMTGALALTAKGGWRRQSAVWLPIVAFGALALTGLLTIGYRHLLPVIPLLALLAGNSVRWLAGRTRGLWAATIALLLLWLAFSTLWFFPNHDSYFNELAGRWTNWSSLLVDSNLDWGQDLPALADVQDELGIERINFAYFGKAVPEKYGVRYTPLPGYLRFMVGREANAWNRISPEPGWYAISATSLRLGTLQSDTVDLYAWFRDRTPVARAGYSIYLYQVEDEPGTTVERALFTAEPVWRAAEQAQGSVGRRVQAKWRQSEGTLIFSPGEGFSPPQDPDYHATGDTLGGVFTLLGYLLETPDPHPGNTVRLWLYWQVGGSLMPMVAPTRGEALSAFVHLADGDPANVVAQFDGWEVALRGLESGDVIAQRVEMALPTSLAAGDYRLLTGLYSPQTMERLLPSSSPDSFLELDPVRVLP